MKQTDYYYPGAVTWVGERRGTLSLEGKPPLDVATPPEFGGHDNTITPEDLFVSSAAVCFMSSFLAMAKKVRANFSSFTCRANGKMELVEQETGLQFTPIHPYHCITIGGE
ncbi:MAG: OsmC family protein, partial [Deltaproteobacteria bacterium]|nr:OsmC family protein [Deltaproteobacteria bacterium]